VTSETPLFVIEKRISPLKVSLASIVVLFLLVGLSLGVPFSPLVRFLHGPESVCVFYPALLLVVFAIVLSVNRWEITRFARVEAYGDRIVLWRRTSRFARIEIPFTAMSAFHDGASDRIEIVPRAGYEQVPRMYLVVPTPDEQSRTRILGLLSEQGVCRAE
jgi:hypothetical protein